MFDFLAGLQLDSIPRMKVVALLVDERLLLEGGGSYSLNLFQPSASKGLQIRYVEKRRGGHAVLRISGFKFIRTIELGIIVVDK